MKSTTGPPPEGSEEESVGPSHEEIARLAYEYWRDRGSRHGHDWEDWFDAEEDLRTGPPKS